MTYAFSWMDDAMAGLEMLRAEAHEIAENRRKEQQGADE